MNWTLNDIQISWLDRAKLAEFCLISNKFSQGPKVAKFEEAMAQFTGYQYAIFCSSGSTSNNILAAYAKDILRVKKVAVPSTTWSTSISPWIRESICPVFVDINLTNLGMDLVKLEELLSKNKNVNAVFVTSLLGIMPDLEKLTKLCEEQNCHLLLDNCESLLSLPNQAYKPTCSTSTYLGHPLSSIEGGFVLTNSESVYEYALLHRAHGLTRVLPKNTQSTYCNPEVDPQFDFALPGSNYRNTEFNALVGLLDLQRVSNNIKFRLNIYSYFANRLDYQRYQLPQLKPGDTPFCLPIILKESNHISRLQLIKKHLTAANIEYRPIVGGNLLRQTAFCSYGQPTDYPNSEFLNNNALYVGLHQKVTYKHIDKLLKLI